MKMSWDNFLVLALILSVIVLAFHYSTPTNANYGEIWEDLSIVATLFYAFVLYLTGFMFKRFQGLKDWQKGLIGLITLLVIPGVSISYILSFLKIFSVNCAGIYNGYLNFERTTKMTILVIVAALFCVVDYIMAKNANNNKIYYTTIFRYSDIPVMLTFAVLLTYAIYIGNAEIKQRNLNHFFEGAIAFQMIFSNIIWLYNDDKIWHSLTDSNNKVTNK